MLGSNNGATLTMPVAPAYASGGTNDGMFGDCSWWIIILFLFIFAGWGNNGFGGGSGSGAMDNYILTSDFSQLSRQLSDSTAMTERKLDSVTNGICSLGYDQLSQMNGINQNISNTGFAIQNAIQADTVSGMQNANALSTQIADCCCSTKSILGDINYNIATQANGITNAMQTGFCQTNFNNANNTRDIIDSQNAGTRAILEAIQANKVEALNQRIAEKDQQINALQLARSQQAQNAYLIDQLGYHCPQAAYVVQPPQTVSFPLGCNGYANYVTAGCGCSGVN
jgi:hypothetical protein